MILILTLEGRLILVPGMEAPNCNFASVIKFNSFSSCQKKQKNVIVSFALSGDDDLRVCSSSQMLILCTKMFSMFSCSTKDGPDDVILWCNKILPDQ